MDVNGQTTIDITLVSDMTELDELVVVGYGTQRKVDLTGSVAVVDAEEMKKVSNSNISTMLQGKAAGVQIIVAINKMDKQDVNPDRIMVSQVQTHRYVFVVLVRLVVQHHCM